MNERDSTVDICVSVDPDLQDNISVRYHSPDETFSAYPESDTESESDDSGNKDGDKEGDVSLPSSPPVFRGINVEDFPLPAHCPRVNVQLQIILLEEKSD